MRHIAKRPEPEVYRLWRVGASDDWKPSWAALQGSVKDTLKNALLDEQGFLCCYCERRIASAGHDAGGCHIEHLEPRATASHRALDYDNLLCSCTAAHGNHCGMRKDNRTITIHPLQPDCTTAFRYRSDGSVEATSGDRRDAAESTLRILGLDDPGLKSRRRKAIEAFLQLTQDLPPSAIRSAAVSLSARDVDGRFVPFATAVQAIVLP